MLPSTTTQTSGQRARAARTVSASLAPLLKLGISTRCLTRARPAAAVGAELPAEIGLQPLHEGSPGRGSTVKRSPSRTRNTSGRSGRRNNGQPFRR